MANDYNAVKITGAETVGVGYSFRLCVKNQDDLLYLRAAGGITEGSAAFAGVPGSYGVGQWPGFEWGASIFCYMSAHRAGGVAPPGWNAEQTAAWDAWIATYTPPTGESIVFADGFLYAAKIGYGSPPGETTDFEWKCFGWITRGYGVGNITGWDWTGDTEWSKIGTVQVDNIQTRVQEDSMASQLYLYPRRWTHRYGAYTQWTAAAPPTTWRVTLGDMSLQTEVSVDADGDGRIDPVQGPGTYTMFGSFRGVHFPQSVDTSYAEVQDISCNIGTVPINLAWSGWATGDPAGGGAWTVQWADPTGQDWHDFNSGNDLILHFVGSAPSTYLGQVWTITEVIGPVAWNVEAARFGDRNTSFPITSLPGTFKADVGLIHYTDETNYDAVLLEPGVSAWYTCSYTSAGGNHLNTGLYVWGTNWEVSPVVDPVWFTASGEELSYQAGQIGNTELAICLPSVAVDPATTTPEWGPALTVVHQDISADIPPGEATRPSAWVAGTGATISGGGTWTIAAAGGTVTRTLLSRYQARMDFLQGCQHSQVGEANADWPITNRANYLLDDDPLIVKAACAQEDVTNYDNSRLLELSFQTGSGGNDWSQARLTLTYRTYLFQDNWQTPASYTSGGANDDRFGVDGHFEHEYVDAEFEFVGFGDPDLDKCYFDLAELARSNSVNLQHVRSLELWLPGPYEALFEDWRLVEDPSEHGGGAGSYPHLESHPAVDPWNWVMQHTGFGGTYEGVTHLNLRNGAEAYRTDVEYGIIQTQYRSWNALWLANQETPPTYDPTTAEALYQGGASRLHEIITLQEQLTGSTLGSGEIIAATEDDEGNVLGPLYPWDLDRPTGDEDPACNASMKLVSMQNFGTGTRLVPVMMTLRWSTHGRAHGIAYQDDAFIRDDGHSDDGVGASSDGHLWRIATGSWERCSHFRPDVTGRWRSSPQREGDYLYGTKWALGAATPDQTTDFKTREYANLLCRFPMLGEMWIVRDSAGHPLWLAAGNNDDQIRTYALSQDETEWLPSETLAFEDAHHRPSLAVDSDGSLIACATDSTTNEMECRRSYDGGTTWEAIVTALGSGLQHGAICNLHGMTYLTGWASNKVYLAASTRADLAREVLDGTNYIIEVCSYTPGAGEDPPLSNPAVHDDGSIVVVVSGTSSTSIYRCRDFTAGFAEVT